MKTLQKYFRHSLGDKYIELALKESERDDFMIALCNEIRQELEGASDNDKLVTYNKMFLVMMDD